MHHLNLAYFLLLFGIPIATLDPGMWESFFHSWNIDKGIPKNNPEDESFHEN